MENWLLQALIAIAIFYYFNKNENDVMLFAIVILASYYMLNKSKEGMYRSGRRVK